MSSYHAPATARPANAPSRPMPAAPSNFLNAGTIIAASMGSAAVRPWSSTSAAGSCRAGLTEPCRCVRQSPGFRPLAEVSADRE
jgi:hypothetical protein